MLRRCHGVWWFATAAQPQEKPSKRIHVAVFNGMPILARSHGQWATVLTFIAKDGVLNEIAILKFNMISTGADLCASDYEW